MFPATIWVINLEDRPDRWTHAVAEFAKIGVHHMQRMRAIHHSLGALGCTLSHIHCLELAIMNNEASVFICEDDITFTNPALFLESFNECIAKVDEIEWDVMLVGGNSAPPYESIPTTTHCVRVFNCQTTVGYIVRRHYYATLLKNFRETASSILRGEKSFIDIHWKKLQKRDRWIMLFPPTVVQYPSYSDIEKRVVDYSQLMLNPFKF